MDRLAVESGARDGALRQSGFDPRDVLPDITIYYTISNGKAAWIIARQWLVIVAALAFAIWSHHWGGYLIAMLVVASRQHALAVIMHDQAHYRLFTSRRAAEWISDFFCAFPVGLSTNLYRRTHLLHHRFTSTEGDPDWVAMMADPDWHWPKAQWDCLKLFLYDIIGLNTLRILRILSNWSPWPRVFTFRDQAALSVEERVRFLIYVALLLTFLAVTGAWFEYLVLWLLPSTTFLSALFRMRAIAEHLGLPHEHELNSTRHVEGSWLERLCIAPLNINYHLAHHMFPAVPLYNLPQLQRRLMQDERFRRQAAITRTYTGLRDGVLSELVHELIAKRRAAVDAAPTPARS